MNNIITFDFIRTIAVTTFFSILLFIFIYQIILFSKIKKGKLKGIKLIETTSGIVILNFKKEKRNWKLNINSLKSIDEKIDEEIQKNSIDKTINNTDLIFMLGSFLGEILKYSIGAKWVIENKDEIPLTMKLKNNEIIFPFERIKKRILNGNSENIYNYGYLLKNNK